MLVALVIGLLAHVASGAVDLSRLREKELTVEFAPAENVLSDVPMVDPPKRTAGYFKLDNATKEAEMFFFFFQARQNPTAAPVVLWMTGGPGCSSELAVLYENGPYTFDKAKATLDLVETEYGWDVTHNMIFVDQPIGTGFSYSKSDDDEVYNEKGVADDMLDFLHHFFAAHPELDGLPLYITGESYAGHYVPAVSHRVWLSNKNKEGAPINFKGLAVGNGLTEPSIQYDAYGDFALQNGLIGQGTRGWMSFLFPLCRLANKWCDSTNWDWLCSLGLTYCMATQFEPILDANPGINVYDYTRKCEGHLCYDFTKADKLLNEASTRAALGVPPNTQWVSCNYDVYQNFAGDWLHRYDDILPDMMEDGIRIMIYAGDLDLICNYLGNRRWVDALDWYGSDYWEDEEDHEWEVVEGQPAGKVKHWGPLSFVQVYKAGHMVPMDQPLNALAMITAWTRNHKVMDVMGVNRLRSGAAAGAGNGDAAVAVEEGAAGARSLPALFARLQDDANLLRPEDAVMRTVGNGRQQRKGRKAGASRGGLRASGVVAKLTAATIRVRAAAQAAARGVTDAARKMMARS